MKKILSIFLAIMLLSAASFAQTYTNKERVPNRIIKFDKTKHVNTSKVSYLSEDFESGLLPTNWTESQGSASTGWLFGDSLGSAYWIIPSHTKYTGVNDDACNCNMSDMLLFTSLINLSTAPNPIISFDYFFNQNYGGTSTLRVSLDSGLTWTTIDTLAGNATWENKTVSLLAYANTDSVLIGFHFNDDGVWAAGIVIDNVIVEDGASDADLVSSATGFVSEYYAQPIDQIVSFIPEGNVENIGTQLSSPTNFILTAGSYSSTQAITVPLANGANEDIMFSSFTPTQGTTTFSYNADYSTDYDPTNNIITKDIVFGGAELIRDNGVNAGNIGVSNTDAGGEMGNIFTIYAQDTITSIKWVMKGTAGDSITAVIRNYTNEPTTELGRTITLLSLGTDTTEYEGVLPVPVVLPAGKYYIGLIEGTGNMGIEYTTDKYIDSTAWAYFNSAWHDLGAINFKHTYRIRPQFNNIYSINDDISMVSINNANVITAGTYDITGTVRNMSNIKNLTSYDVVYSINGGTSTATYSITGISIAPGGTHNFTHNVQWTATTGTQTIEVEISNPNNIADEDPSDNSLSKTINVASELYSKTVVYEEGTGTWCGWCVRGLVGLNTMAHDIDDGTWIGIAVHNGDPMTNTEYDASISAFISGYPSGLADRHITPVDPGLAKLQEVYNNHRLISTIAKIEITNKTYNNSTRDWTMDVASTFGVDISNANYNTALIIVESEITGSGPGWEQHNYYAGGANGDMIDYDGTNYANLQSTVPAADMTYNHVGRELVDGFGGSANSVPTVITSGTANSFAYSGTLSADYDENNITFVALLIDNTTNEIVNATELDLLTVGIMEVNANNYSIYPNPTTGIITIEGTMNADITVMNMIGDIIYQNNNASQNTIIDLSAYAAGNYIVKIINDNKVSTQKIILTK